MVSVTGYVAVRVMVWFRSMLTAKAIIIISQVLLFDKSIGNII